MIFNKPKNITFTQMAQWVDANTSIHDHDKDIMCEYLYHLIYLRAKQTSVFTDPQQLDDFVIYCVSRLLKRLQNNTRSTEPIKSIVNYIKNILDLWKSDYIREFCSGSPDAEILDFNLLDYGDYLVDTSSIKYPSTYYLNNLDVSSMFKKVLSTIPRKKYSAEWSNIYVSCLLTFNDRLNTSKILLKKFNKEDPFEIQNQTAVLRSVRTRTPILFHLDDSMSNYISVLVNKITHEISAELTSFSGHLVSVSDCLNSMVAAASEEEIENKL